MTTEINDFGARAETRAAMADPLLPAPAPVAPASPAAPARGAKAPAQETQLKLVQLRQDFAPQPLARPSTPTPATAPDQDSTDRDSAPEPGPAGSHLRDRTDELNQLKRAIRHEPGTKATNSQHDKGKLTVHERLELLFDEGTFVELEQLRQHRAVSFGLDRRRPHSDGVVIGWGLVCGQQVFSYAHDFRIFGGALGEAHAAKIHKIMDMALAAGAPLVSLCDGAGARIQEGVTALAGYGGIFQRNVSASGVIPQISVILGPCAGGAAYSPALTDFIFMVRDIAQMFITGPDVVEAVTGEKITLNELGGASVHERSSGLASFVYDDESSCIEDVRYLLSLLPPNNRTAPPRLETSDPEDRLSDALLDIVPADSAQAYEMRGVLKEILDDGEYLEVQEAWATNVVCVLGSLGGRVIGVVANQPLVAAGTLDIHASEKAARFVQMCDAFSIPIITVVDVPGFLPGREQEHNGIIRHGAKLLYAYCQATVPRIQLILRKAYGGAWIVMDSPAIGTDLSLAWPINEIAVMGAEGAANIIFRREISESDTPEQTRLERIESYRSELMQPYYAAERGLVDDVIDPSTTRPTLIRALRMLERKHKALPERKHGNQPI